MHETRPRLGCWFYFGLMMVLIFVVSIAACVGFGWQMREYHAIYQDFEVRSGGNSGLVVGTPGRTPRPIPGNIFIRVADGSVYALRDLPESVAAQYLEKPESWKPAPPEFATYSGGWRTLLKYRHGKLIYAWIDFAWDDLTVSSSPDGPFYKLPLTNEQTVELFGEPLEWKRPGKVPSGP